jgi:imidazolonepropionase
LASKKYNLIPKVHANQLSNSGGVQAGIKVGAVSVDHLEYIGTKEINLLLNSSTMPVLLPGAAFFLGLPFPPARDLIQAGLPVAIASDYNPGSSPSGNMNFMVSLACIKMNMTPEQAILAATLNSAYAMHLASVVGSITLGNKANFIITKKIPSYAYIPYSFANNHIDQVIINAKIHEEITF